METMQRRAAFALGLCAAVALGVVFRMHTRAQVDDGAGVRLFDSDTAYHLRRARFAAAHFPRTIVFDPLMNFPEGGVPIWPPLFDLALAAPARLAAGPGASGDAVARGAAWVVVVLAAGAVALAGFLGRRLHGIGAGVAAAAFLAACPGHILWTQYGHADQHVAESFCGLLALVLFLASREAPDSGGNARREAAAGLGLALAVLAWQGGIFWGAIFALALFLEAAAGRPVLRAIAWTLGLPALVTAAATAAWLTWLEPPLTYVSFGYFQPLFLAALCGGTAILALAVRAARGATRPREALATLGLAAAAAAVTLPFAPALLAGLAKGIGYVAGSTSDSLAQGGFLSYSKDLLAGIHEAQPLLEGGPALAWKQLSAAFFLAPLACLAWAARARRGDRPGVHGALAVWGAVTLFLALSQRVNVYYAAPLCALTLIEASRWIASRIPGSRRGLVAAAAGLLLALPMVRGLSEELSTEHVPGSDLQRTLGWMRTEIPHAVDAYDPGLLGPPPFPAGLSATSSVIAPWSLGHFLLYGTELPVVANNFGYGFLESIRFFLAESEQDALAVARRHRARWIVATDLSARMNDYASYLGRPRLLRDTPQGPVPEPAYLATLQCRLYDFGGRGGKVEAGEVLPLENVRLVHRSETAIRRFGRWVPRWAVFEITDPSFYGAGGDAGTP
jgi:dolichyl-diphosphooligosaccharide--protein glycosyltransferase